MIIDFHNFFNLLSEKRWFTPLELNYIKENKNEFRIHKADINMLLDNLRIGIDTSQYSGKNVDDLKVLFNRIKNIRETTILNMDIKIPNRGTRSIYFDKDVTELYGMLG